ncbi:Leucine permease transcriptional regulator [Ancistrocladus abbreviatus]
MINKRENSALVILYFHVMSIVLGLMGKNNWVQGQSLLNSSRLAMFVDHLPDMPKVYACGVVGGKPMPTSLTIGMFYKRWKFHRDLPPTPVFAYGLSAALATVPGPTIVAFQGIATNITWKNYLPSQHILPWDSTIPTAMQANKTGVPTVVHLHGGIDEPESDGHAAAWFTADFVETGPTWTKRMYHYHNMQHPGNMWYHDHTVGLTRENILAGLIGAYQLHQPNVDGLLGLPTGEYDRTLVIFDRMFYTNGSIYMNQTGVNPSIHPQWQPEYFGDVIVVNGKAWPLMLVERRRYRFRIINASNARFFRLYFLNKTLNFTYVGSDSAYLNHPVSTNQTLLAPSEIADVIVDFAQTSVDNVTLANDAPYPFPSGDSVNDANSKVMKFNIIGQSGYDQSTIPSNLLNYSSPDVSTSVRTRYITFYEYLSNSGDPTHLYINAVPFEAPVTETPKVGSNELWYVINLTEDNHPLHIHLALFSALNQTQLVDFDAFKSCMFQYNDAVRCNISDHARGNVVDVPAQEKGWKNVFKMMPGFVTAILVRFSYIHTNASYPFDASTEPGYVYHCHIFDHEDNVMMRPLKMVN